METKHKFSMDPSLNKESWPEGPGFGLPLKRAMGHCLWRVQEFKSQESEASKKMMSLRSGSFIPTSELKAIPSPDS